METVHLVESVTVTRESAILINIGVLNAKVNPSGPGNPWKTPCKILVDGYITCIIWELKCYNSSYY